MRHTTIAFICLLAFNIQGQFVSTIAGQLEEEGANNGDALEEATFTNPHGITADAEGNVYIADRFGHRIRKYTQDGVVSTIAGNGIKGNADGNGISAFFNEPWGVCIGNDGFIYVADTRNNLIRRIDEEGEVTTFAGSGNYGGTDGMGISASFGNPTGLEMDSEGNLYVADHLTHTIRKIDSQGIVTTIAGLAGEAGYQDGTGSDARFYRPYGLTIDNDGNILVADEWNHRIRKITPEGQVTTIAGNGNIGYQNGIDIDTEFNYPWDISVDEDGNLYVADGYNQVIRIMKSQGTVPESYEVSLYAGNPGVSGGIDGFASGASFNAATSIHYWADEQAFFIADAYNNLIRRVDRYQRPIVNAFTLDAQGNALDPQEPLVVCPGVPINVIATPDTLNHYYFYVNGDEVQSSPDWRMTYNYFEEDTLEVQVIATDIYGLLYSNNLQIIVEDFVLEDFSADQLEIDRTNREVQFSIEGDQSNIVSYLWDFGDPSSGEENFSDFPNPTHTYSGPGNYTVSLIVENSQGCLDTLVKSDYIIYNVIEPEDIIFIPDAFTPNGDGNNDVLFVRGEFITDLSFTVFNQWGERVFETHSLNDGWDGSYKGKAASACTYTYLVKVTTNAGRKITKAGHVSIIR
jgi:gliding motility-associated-like protein